ncbi:hypothetical protein PGR6_43120 [Pseudomonas sp. GR 6-02]|nr:hypothetical protein PGR6_43120 [Pseudomonas sp. GR 6-02]
MCRFKKVFCRNFGIPIYNTIKFHFGVEINGNFKLCHLDSLYHASTIYKHAKHSIQPIAIRISPAINHIKLYCEVKWFAVNHLSFTPKAF